MDALKAVERAKEMVKERAGPILGNDLIPRIPGGAAIRAKTIARSALHLAVTNVLIERKIVNADMCLWMKMTSASAMHGRRSVIEKVAYLMHCHPRGSKDLS